MQGAVKPFDVRQYWEDRLSTKWGLHGAGHISYGRPYNEWLYRVRRRVFLRHLHALSTDLGNAAVLDVGSGTGFWLKMWRSVGVRKLVGSDLTCVAVENLRKENPEMEIRQLDITEPDAVTGMESQFDVISAFDVLFHITEEERFRSALRNVAAMLRPGGYLIFSDSLLHNAPKRALHEVDRTLQDYVRELRFNALRTECRVPVFVLMNIPIDSSSEIRKFCWRLFMAPVRLFHPLGYLFGCALYPFEVFLTSNLREGPSTEMMICKKL